jgi:hypothetical protein
MTADNSRLNQSEKHACARIAAGCEAYKYGEVRCCLDVETLAPCWGALCPDPALSRAPIAPQKPADGARAVPIEDFFQLMAAMAEFQVELPDWWFSVCACSVSRDASCGPDRNGRDAHLLEDHLFDDGFHADLKDGSMADALREVMRMALEARAERLAETERGA